MAGSGGRWKLLAMAFVSQGKPPVNTYFFTAFFFSFFVSIVLSDSIVKLQYTVFANISISETFQKQHQQYGCQGERRSTPCLHCLRGENTNWQFLGVRENYKQAYKQREG